MLNGQRRSERSKHMLVDTVLFELGTRNIGRWVKVKNPVHKGGEFTADKLFSLDDRDPYRSPSGKRIICILSIPMVIRGR